MEAYFHEPVASWVKLIPNMLSKAIAKSDNDQTTKSIESRFVKLVSLLAD